MRHEPCYCAARVVSLPKSAGFDVAPWRALAKQLARGEGSQEPKQRNRLQNDVHNRFAAGQQLDEGDDQRRAHRQEEE